MTIVIVFTLGILIGALALVLMRPKEKPNTNCGHCDKDCGKCK